MGFSPLAMWLRIHSVGRTPEREGPSDLRSCLGAGLARLLLWERSSFAVVHPEQDSYLHLSGLLVYIQA